MSVCYSDQLVSVREDDKDDLPTVDEIVSVSLKECRKENVVYKMEALQCAASILQSFDVDRMKDVADILLPVLPRVCCPHYS